MYRKYKKVRNDSNFISQRDTKQANIRDVKIQSQKVVDYNLYDFYELEPAEVNQVLLDESLDKFPNDENGDTNFQYYGAIKASYF